MEGSIRITEEIIRAAIAVHRALGPDLLESTYEACLLHELIEGGVAVERQKPLPVTCRGARIECGYRLDLLVGREVIVIRRMVHEAGRRESG